MTEGRGETPDAGHEGTESLPAKRDTQSPATGESHRRPLNSIEPPWYGPVCPVVWEGRSREAPPYPHQWPLCQFGSDRAGPADRRASRPPRPGMAVMSSRDRIYELNESPSPPPRPPGMLLVFGLET